LGSISLAESYGKLYPVVTAILDSWLTQNASPL